jgi:hypothetical protein
MKIARLALLGVTLVVAFGAAALAQMAPSTVTIKMVALNNSGENGSATITQLKNGNVSVAVHLMNAPADIPQPTHIHIGTCGHINKAPEYPLSNTVDGKGVSTAPVSLANLLKGQYAINVHKSGMALGTYVSCGNITAK